jgi:hypothetical protein
MLRGEVVMVRSVHGSAAAWAALRRRVEAGQTPQPWHEEGGLTLGRGKYGARKRRKKGRRKPREPRGLRGRCLEAQAQEAAVRQAALDSGLALRVNTVRCGRTGLTLHWMFDDQGTGRRLLDYWPSRGRWYSPLTGAKGKVPDWWAALDEAQRVGVRLYSCSGG